MVDCTGYTKDPLEVVPFPPSCPDLAGATLPNQPASTGNLVWFNDFEDFSVNRVQNFADSNTALQT